MPKKTKKQKILAQLHRKTIFSVPGQTNHPSSNPDLVKSQNNYSIQNQLPVYSNSFKYAKDTVAKAKNMKITPSYTHVQHDLIRITIFTILALAIQGMLYFLLRTR